LPQLIPLSERRDLYVEYTSTFDTFICTKTEPRIVLSVKSHSNPSGGLTATAKGNVIAHYGGTTENLMFFYVLQSGLLTIQPPSLFYYTPVSTELHKIRDVESSNFILFHRQPFYLLGSGLLTTTWTVNHFDSDPSELHEVDLSGIGIDDNLIVVGTKNDEFIRIVILRNAKKERN
ncbi:hypothetical protein PFISCL1PPCAC_10833, partial [Pristionchus fissidentatus]